MRRFARRDEADRKMFYDIGYCWQTPPAPEARGILAGGGAKRSRRKRHDSITRPERAPDRDWSCCEFRSCVPAGTRAIFFDLSRWLRFAPPPANFRRLSGAENNFAEFASSITPVRTPSHASLSAPGHPCTKINVSWNCGSRRSGKSNVSYRSVFWRRTGQQPQYTAKDTLDNQSIRCRVT